MLNQYYSGIRECHILIKENSIPHRRYSKNCQVKSNAMNSSRQTYTSEIINESFEDIKVAELLTPSRSHVSLTSLNLKMQMSTLNETFNSPLFRGFAKRIARTFARRDPPLVRKIRGEADGGRVKSRE